MQIKIAAVIVTFNPVNEDLANIESIKNQFDHLIIVSNSDSQIIDEFSRKISSDHITIINNQDNLGLGKALNQGMIEAFRLGFKMCATFDQDSKILPNYRDEMLKTYLYFKDSNDIGIIAPNYSNDFLQNKTYKNKENFFLIDNAVQSGSIFLKDCIDVCGLFRDDFFIECIDTEFCMRVQANGFSIISSQTVLMIHGAGKKISKNFFGKRVIVTNHNSRRLYLQYRNFAYVFRCYFLFHPIWAMKSLFNMAKKYFLIIVFEKNRLKKSFLIFKGFLKGLFHFGVFND